MPTSLEAIRDKLIARARTLDVAFERHALSPVCRMRTDRFALQEGLVSSLWQAWCSFCRETVIGSARGITTRSGVATSPFAGRAEMEIAYVAKEFAQRRKVVTVKALSAIYLEPTWGDLSKINLIITGIGSSNQSYLASAFGIGMAILDLQLCRNASAHLNNGTMAAVTAARVKYSQTKFSHPSDIMFWIDPLTKDYLWKTWIEEIENISNLAIN